MSMNMSDALIPGVVAACLHHVAMADTILSDDSERPIMAYCAGNEAMSARHALAACRKDEGAAMYVPTLEIIVESVSIRAKGSIRYYECMAEMDQARRRCGALQEEIPDM